MTEDTAVTIDRHLTYRPNVVLPTIIAESGPAAVRRFTEFFTAEISNANTRAAYTGAVMEFCGWCERHELSLSAVSPVAVGLS